MIGRTMTRLARMDAREITWRGTTAARTLLDRARTHLASSGWTRDALLPALAPQGGMTTVRAALTARRWDVAHCELSQHFARATQRFVIGPRENSALAERIRGDFPDASDHAVSRANRCLAGDYDLLGYHGLRFDTGPPALAALPDWHLDPVHRRRAPRTFWSTVPYLDPAYGDHKIIWELNRHQHWLALGRAFWLTGKPMYRDRFIAELSSWLDDNPPLVGINWASMLELAFRSISWIWAINLFADHPPGAGVSTGPPRDASPWLVDLLIGLDRQLAHIEHNLSHYFSPNTHLLGEALALYVAGRALPELAASPRRASIGRRILLEQIDRQIADDGGHCERSTHYHRYTLDFYTLALIIARKTDDEAAAPFEDAVARLAHAARLLADDRGQLPHIGDDDGGALTPITGRQPHDVRDSLATAAALVNRPELQSGGSAPEETLWMLGPSFQPHAGNPLAFPSGALGSTGYYVSRSAASDHLVIDGGPHGYQNGGHAHADALSLTFAVRGVPLLIDPGTASYTADPIVRDRMRSSALHNTLTLDGQSQSLSRGPFHWSHVANAQVHAWRTGEGFDYFDGAHDGYRPLVHRRRVLALHGNLLIVADYIAGSGLHTAAVHWHLDPRWTVATRDRRAAFTVGASGEDRVGLTVARGAMENFTADAGTGLGWWSPAYGRLDRTTTIRVSHSGAAPFWMASVFDLDLHNIVTEVAWEPAETEHGPATHSVAMRITRARSVDRVAFTDHTFFHSSTKDQLCAASQVS